MDSIRRRISNIGVFLALSAILSAVLQLIGYELRILRPLNDAPPLLAWGIRLGLLVVGVALFFVGPSDDQQESGASPAPGPTKEQLAHDPRMAFLVSWVGQNMGATLNPAAGYPRIAHLAFWDSRSLPTTPFDPTASQAVAYVDNFQQGRWCVVSPVGSQVAQPSPVSADGWAYNVPDAA